jgi:hypothetical protein
MSSLTRAAQMEFLSRPIHNHQFQTADLLAEPVVILEALVLVVHMFTQQMDMSTVTVEQLETITSTFAFVVRCNTDMHGFGCWFDVDFCSSDDVCLLSVFFHIIWSEIRLAVNITIITADTLEACTWMCAVAALMNTDSACL